MLNHFHSILCRPAAKDATKKSRKMKTLPGLEEKSSQPPKRKTTPKSRPIPTYFLKELTVTPLEKEEEISKTAVAIPVASTIDLSSTPQTSSKSRRRHRSSLNRHPDDEEWAELERQEMAPSTSSASPAIEVDFEFERPKPWNGGGGIVHAKTKKIGSQVSSNYWKLLKGIYCTTIVSIVFDCVFMIYSMTAHHQSLGLCKS